MPIQNISIEKLHTLANVIIIDVRSESEYEYAHIPKAINIPIFNDAQRTEIGTAYKKQSRQKAVDIGLKYFNDRQQEIFSKFQILNTKSQILNYQSTINNELSPINNLQSAIIYCARGGMRSNAVAWLFNLYGYDIKLITGGYKAYRNWALQQFEKKYNFKILGGYTGSGKTKKLYEFENDINAIIDLEKNANHKGSAFGAINMPIQPKQEMFENILAEELYLKQDKTIWLEDESQRLGLVRVPNGIWEQMRNTQPLFMNVDFETRLNNIVNEYGNLPLDELIKSTERITKKIGGQNAKEIITLLSNNEIKNAFEILLKYYDKKYMQGMEKRTDKIPIYLWQRNSKNDE